MVTKYVKILFISVLLLSSSTKVWGMALFDFFKIYVFSDVNGTVLLEGKPVQGAEIIRTADHEEDKVYTDSTTTDANGHFSLPPISTYSLRPIMLGTIIRQEIIIRYDGKEYLAWKTIKMNNHIYGELNDAGIENPVKFHLKCELTENQEKYEVIKLRHRNSRVTGLCSWH